MGVSNPVASAYLIQFRIQFTANHCTQLAELKSHLEPRFAASVPTKHTQGGWKRRQATQLKVSCEYFNFSLCEHFLTAQMKNYFKSNDANAYKIGRRKKLLVMEIDVLSVSFPFKFQ